MTPSGVRPLGCQCPFCNGAAYTLGTMPGDSTATPTRWTQAGGLGSPLTITYSYSNLLNGSLPGGLDAGTIRLAIQEAFSRWASVAPLRFVEVADSGPMPLASPIEYAPAGKAMIRLGQVPLDGPAGKLAIGYYPGGTGLSGDVIFDSSERWGIDPTRGTDLLEVATHEIGHALGLAHSSVSPSIMAPLYASRFRGLGTSYLFADDVAGIRALYGAGTGSVAGFGTRVFSVSGNTLYVQGTAGNDTLFFDGSTTPTLRLNGVTYTGNLDSIRNIVFLAGAGSDRSTVTGTSQSETFAMGSGFLRVTGPRWNISADGSEVIDVTGGAGDEAILTDSVGNDLLYARPGMTQLTGGGYTLIARGFASTTTVCNIGGKDNAVLNDGNGNDTYTASLTQARMQGDGYSVIARGFDVVAAFASGGVDSAHFTDSAGNDTFICGTLLATMSNQANSYRITGYGFENVQATATMGVDTAQLFGASGDDTFVATPSYGSLYGASCNWQAGGFDQVNASSQGGRDVAYIYDSAGNDQFVAKAKVGLLTYTGGQIQFEGFTTAVLSGTTGGVNRRAVVAAGYTLNWVGAWL